MKRVVLTYGLIGGVMIACLVWLIAILCNRNILDFDKGALYGYSAMIVALTMVFFGIKSYRDNYGNGVITFWKGVQIGLLITLIGSFMYFLSWSAYGRLHPDHMQKIMAKLDESTTEKMRNDGKSQKEIDDQIAFTHQMFEWFKNPFLGFAESLIVEMGPVGLVVTLISAGLLRKRELLPA